MTDNGFDDFGFGDDPTPAVKPPPHSLEAEQSVIGALMIDASQWAGVSEVIDQDSFYRTEHQLIWRAMKTLAEKGEPMDVITMGEALGSWLDEIGGMAYLNELAENTPSLSNVIAYAKIIKEKALSRSLMGLGTQLNDDAQAQEPGNVLGWLQSKVSELIMGTVKRSRMVSIEDALRRAVDYIDERFNHPDKPGGQLTGYSQLDSLIDGFQDGQRYIIAGRPSAGKTAITLNMISRASVRSGRWWVVFSIEMGARSLVMRFISTESGIDGDTLKKGSLNDSEWVKLTPAFQRVQEYRLYIDESPEQTATSIRAALSAMQVQLGGLGGIVVDHMALVTPPKGVGRTEGMTAVFNDVNGLGKEFDCPLIMVCQLNRELEKRPNKRPIVSDLRDTGTAEQNADVIMFVYRDEVYNEDTPYPGVTELIIAKNREGALRTIPFTSRLATMQYAELTEMPNDPEDEAL